MFDFKIANSANKIGLLLAVRLLPVGLCCSRSVRSHVTPSDLSAVTASVMEIHPVPFGSNLSKALQIPTKRNYSCVAFVLVQLTSVC